MTDNGPILGVTEWQERARTFSGRMASRVRPHLERRSRQEKHPVYDFLFEYYSFRPAQLLTWSPGFGVALERDHRTPLEQQPAVTPCPGSPAHAPSSIRKQRLAGLKWIVTLLRNTAERPPRYACFGLHEWAMVYEEESIRHRDPLRLPHAEVRRLVEDLPICCSHCDAFRFFPASARPLNRLQPTRSNQAELEQPGCLHANMDLYKWAYKFYPWTPSDLIGEAFLLAMRLRELDMRASPYDLANHDVEPLCIETPGGRQEYVQAQSLLATEAQALRYRLLRHYETLWEAVDKDVERITLSS